MRLLQRVLFPLVAVLLLVGAAYAVVRTRREFETFESDARRDHLFVARTLRAAMLDVARTDGAPRARSLLRAADRGYPGVELRLVRVDQPETDEQRPRVAIDALDAVRRGREFEIVASNQWLTYVPVELEPHQPWAIEVAESIERVHAYQRETVVRNAIATLITTALCALMAAWLGNRLIARPLGRLAAKARRVGRGDFNDPVPEDVRDELGELAHEINTMSAELQRAQARLLEETATRLRTLEALRHADKLRTIGQLAAGIAHELGTPLNVAMGRASLLLRAEVTEENLRENATIVIEQCKRMAAMIRRLLDFGRKSEPSAAPTDLMELGAQSVALLEPFARDRGCSLALVSDCDAALVTADAALLQQVIANFIVNAIQATPNGGEIRVRTGTREVQPPLPNDARARYAFLTVSDEGVGMSAEQASRVFEPFFTTKDVGEGTGLGLTVAYGIARDHGGWIEVDSTPSVGTHVTLYLPLRDEGETPFS
ncbi:MAG: HAMP domain-containing sensor histidine kinase [Polyangiales bacterium]